MDESVSKTNDVQQATPPSYLSVMARALASAAIFGYLGSRLGRHLGIRGNAANSDLARPLMKWGMGIFWAFLAAFCSLKSSETAAKAEQPACPLSAAEPPSEVPQKQVADTTVPTAAIHAPSATHDGEMTENPEKQRA